MAQSIASLAGPLFCLNACAGSGACLAGWTSSCAGSRSRSPTYDRPSEQAADRIVSSFQQSLMQIRSTLSDSPQMLEPGTGDSVVVVLSTAGIEIHPPSVLLYQPSIPADPEPPIKPYSKGEQYEFKQLDYTQAIDEFLKLTRSPDAAICAGAYLRIARNHRKAGNFDLALGAYEKLSQFREVRIGGVPAELVGRRARCVLFAELGKI